MRMKEGKIVASKIPKNIRAKRRPVKFVAAAVHMVTILPTTGFSGMSDKSL